MAESKLRCKHKTEKLPSRDNTQQDKIVKEIFILSTQEVSSYQINIVYLFSSSFLNIYTIMMANAQYQIVNPAYVAITPSLLQDPLGKTHAYCYKTHDSLTIV